MRRPGVRIPSRPPSFKRGPRACIVGATASFREGEDSVCLVATANRCARNLSRRSKVVHCTLHNFHVEGKDLDTAYGEFKLAHCDSCPDVKPRPDEWRYTNTERKRIQARNLEFVKRLAGTPYGIRHTKED
jgi:hypothetical protein